MKSQKLTPTQKLKEEAEYWKNRTINWEKSCNEISKQYEALKLTNQANINKFHRLEAAYNEQREALQQIAVSLACKGH